MSNNNNKFIYLAIVTFLLLLIIPFLQLNYVFILLFILIIYTAIIIFLMPPSAIFLLILIRPSLDIFTSFTVISLENFHLNFSSVLAIITLAFTFYILLINRRSLKELPLLVPVTVFLAIAFISIFFSFDKIVSLTEALRLLSIFSLYYLSYIFIKTDKDLGYLLKIIIASVVIPTALAIYQYITYTGISLPFEGIYNRIYGTFAHPNLLAYYLIIPIALLIYLFIIKDKKRIENVTLIIPLFILLIILILTFTRGAWLALVIFIFIIGTVKYRKLLYLTFIILILSYFIIIPIKDRVNNLIANPYSSVTWRLGLWADGLSYVKEKPILGQGTGTASQFILNKRGQALGSSDPHNDYLKITLENGAIGLLSYLFIIGSLLYVLIKKYFIVKEPNLKIFILFIMSISVSLFIMSFADNILRNTALQWVFWSLIGASLAITIRETN